MSIFLGNESGNFFGVEQITTNLQQQFPYKIQSRDYCSANICIFTKPKYNRSINSENSGKRFPKNIRKFNKSPNKVRSYRNAKKCFVFFNIRVRKKLIWYSWIHTNDNHPNKNWMARIMKFPARFDEKIFFFCHAYVHAIRSG